MSSDATSPPVNGNGHPDHLDWAPAQRIVSLTAVVGLVAFAALGIINIASGGEGHGPGEKPRFVLSYLVGWTFWFALPLGSTALLMIHYLAKTSWGLLLTRYLEAATRTLPLTIALFIPIGIAACMPNLSPYWWTTPDTSLVTPSMLEADRKVKEFEAERDQGQKITVTPTAADMSLVQQKRAVDHEVHERMEGTLSFLSPPMFVGCSIGYFVIWGLIIRCLNKWGQDAQSDPALVGPSLEKLKNLSGPGLIIYAISITAAVSQWVMSVEVSWASTMFPVIFAVEQFLITLCFSVAIFLTLSTREPIKSIMRPKFQIDMGSFMLALTLFWTYTSFSQMMLIWIGNLPEEIPYYLKRSVPEYGFWWCISAALIVFHFALPFILLLFRDIKLHRGRLRAVAIYLVVVCAMDVMWWIAPTFPQDGLLLHVLTDIAALVGIGGLWGSYFLWQLKQRPILPGNQLYMLPKGHDHEHH